MKSSNSSDLVGSVTLATPLTLWQASGVAATEKGNGKSPRSEQIARQRASGRGRSQLQRAMVSRRSQC